MMVQDIRNVWNHQIHCIGIFCIEKSIDREPCGTSITSSKRLLVEMMTHK